MLFREAPLQKSYAPDEKFKDMCNLLVKFVKCKMRSDFGARGINF